MHRARPILLLTAVIILTACSAGGGFVSVDQKFGSAIPKSGQHTVSRGETLYSIAFRYGLDYHQLASANSIASPYVIYPGQKIDVSGRGSRVASRPATTVKNPSTQPVATEKSAQVPPVVAQKPPVMANDTAVTGWQWPANGKIVARFSVSKPVSKGIDISTPLGEPVLAAAAGTVVYAGTGLRGYGNLIIVRHNDTYLSAYAHASRILVRENQTIKAGEKIAETGSTGTDEVKLHFEIRENGKPVDPLKFLPGM